MKQYACLRIRPLVGVNPLVRRLIEIARDDPRSFSEIEKRAGVSSRYLSTIGRPHSANRPQLACLNALAEELGYELKLVKR